MKDKYTQVFTLSANDHSVSEHDAVLIEFTASDASAQLYTFDKNIHFNVKGNPDLGKSSYTPATGPTVTIRGGTYESQYILPVQVKGTGTQTNCVVYGMKR